jgi:hypothetical protein
MITKYDAWLASGLHSCPDCGKDTFVIAIGEAGFQTLRCANQQCGASFRIEQATGNVTRLSDQRGVRRKW